MRFVEGQQLSTGVFGISRDFEDLQQSGVLEVTGVTD